MPDLADISSTPAVAVCIPLYNKAKFIAETVRSVLQQEFENFELVVLDNASTDGSAEIVEKINDPRIVLVRNELTIPPVDNFNRSVRLSRAALVKVLCADDLIRSDCLGRQVDTMNADPTLAMVTCRQNMIDEHGEILARDRILRTPDLVGRQVRQDVVRRLVRHGGNPIGNPGNVLFRRSAFDAVGGFSTEIDFYAAEVDLWIRLLEHGAFFGIPESLASFRLSSESDSRKLGRSVVQVQRDFIQGVRRRNATVLRPRDVALSALRAPLTALRQRVILAASTSGSRAGFARRIVAARRPIRET